MSETKRLGIDLVRGVVELGRCKVQLKDLNRRLGIKKRERTLAVDQLGAETWQLRARDDRYGSEFDQLISLEHQRNETQRKLKNRRLGIEQHEQEHGQIDERFTAVLDRIELELKGRSGALGEATKRRKAVEKTHKALSSRLKTERSHLRSTGRKLEKATSAALEDAELVSLQHRRRELEASLSALTEEITSNRDEVSRHLDYEARCRDAADEQKKLLAEQKEQRLKALKPSSQALKELRAQIVELEKATADQDKQQTIRIRELGIRVNTARPPVDGLSKNYGTIDGHDAEIQRLKGEMSVLEDKIRAAGPGAKRTFYGAVSLFLLGCLGTLVAILVSYAPDGIWSSSKGELLVRVVDGDQRPVLGAGAVLFFEGGPVAQYSDIHGSATLKLDDARGRRGRLVVEATGFKIHEQSVRLKSGGLVEVRLEPPDPVLANVLVRTVDSASQAPVAGAEVLVMANGDAFSEAGDSNGLSKFTLAFEDSKVDAEMNVRLKGYSIEHQRITLLPDQVQDIVLDRGADLLRVHAFDIETAVGRNFREAENQVLKAGTQAIGSLRKDTEVAFTFSGHPNTPILFVVERTNGELGYQAQIHDPKDFLILDLGNFYSGSQDIPFTPSSEGDYRLVLKGTRGGGHYSVNMIYLSGPPTKRNMISPLTTERSEKGMLAVGAHDDFSFQGSANTPLLFRVQRATGDLGYSVEIFDHKQTSIAVFGHFWGGLKEIPFTPPSDGSYTVRIQGNRNLGSYTLALQQIAGGVEGRNKVVALDLERNHEGDLGVGASDTYRFEGQINTPLLFTLQRTRGELGYLIEIYDSQNRRLGQYGRFSSGTNHIPFTPQSNGDLELRVVAERNFGSYGLKMKLVSGPASERNQIIPLAVGGSLEGKLATGAFDDYRIAGRAGQRLVLTTQHLNGELGYWVLIYDSSDQELAKHGRFYSGTNRMEFVPPIDADYKVRVLSDVEFGPYLITLNESL